MAEAARKKLNITKAQVAATKPVKPRRFVASFDATNLDAAGVARALRQLADSVEARSMDVVKQVEELRERVVARDPDLASTTRLAPRQDEAATSYAVAADGVTLGTANFITISPPKPAPRKRKPPKRAPPPPRPASPIPLFGPLAPLASDQFDAWEERLLLAQQAVFAAAREESSSSYQEDDEVEFWHQSEWKFGIVLDQASQFTYLIEDKYGRKWEVNQACLRRPE